MIFKNRLKLANLTLAAKLSIFSSLLLSLLLAAILFTPKAGASKSPVQSSSDTTNLKRHRPDFVPGEILVRFKHGQALQGITQLSVPNSDEASKQLGLIENAPGEEVSVEISRFDGSDIVDGLRMARTAPENTLKAIDALQARNEVLYAEPNYRVHLDKTPNDTLFSSLYGITKIGAPQAWETTQGDRSVVVGIVDEGIDVSHPDLQANIWTNPAPGSISGITGDLHGYDFINNSGIIPAEPHATHVAGTIGAVGNNSQGVVGVNWEVSLMSLRFIDDASGFGTDADALRALNYAKQMRDLWTSSGGTKGANIRALNASYGGGGYSQAAADAINALGQSGVLFVAAAGNDASDTDLHPNYPSGYGLSNVMSVAATTSTDSLAGFSNYGLHSVLLGAPGQSILSTTPRNQTLCFTQFTDPNGYTYSICSGTSMATPHVTGAAALLCAANPNLTVTQLRALLSFNGDAISALQGKSLSGRRLNVANSLQALNEGDNTPPGTPANFQINFQNGRSVGLSWTASGDDGNSGQASLYDLSFVDQTTGAVIPESSIPPATPGVQQSTSLNLPYRHTAGTFRLREFDNVGNEGTPATVAVSVPPNFADPYTTALNSPAALSTGGTGLGLTADDRYENYQLPFAFPFFGQTFGTVTISTNGNLYFSTPPKRSNGDADDVPSSVGDLGRYKMIAGMWDDLDLRTSRRADADVYVVQPGAGRIIFRWQGVQYGDGVNGAQINFEIELRNDGTVITRYGSGNTNLNPVVGISGGEPDPYVIDSLTSELSLKSLTNAQSASFAARSTVQLSSSSYSVNEGDGHIDIGLSRSGDTSSSATVSFATSDSAGSQDCNVANGAASSRCDYVANISNVQFAAGEISKSISIPIVDDAFVEGNETFKVTLNNGSGTSLGAQSTATVTIVDNDSTTGSNPSDVPTFFVRQNYLDFLNREPDSSGLAFWTNEINSCGADQTCIAAKRVSVSAAFFLSIEFQQTGYLVERFYKSAFGDVTGTSTLNGSHSIQVPIIRFNEFLPDTEQIGQGVIVGQGDWQTTLENNKQSFALQFVQRSRFTTAFPNSMTPAQFVDRLNSNAGNVLSASERTNDIAFFGAATDSSSISTRAQILRQVAENQNLFNAENNRAFVMMQFFGYLRRNPNEAPDSDYSGYDFWLSKLTQFNGDFVGAEMVKAFITSSEYRQRFGP